MNFGFLLLISTKSDQNKFGKESRSHSRYRLKLPKVLCPLLGWINVASITPHPLDVKLQSKSSLSSFKNTALVSPFIWNLARLYQQLYRQEYHSEWKPIWIAFTISWSQSTVIGLHSTFIDEIRILSFLTSLWKKLACQHICVLCKPQKLTWTSWKRMNKEDKIKK